MLNYVVDPRLITPLVPPETEIDFENGETFLSVVGFLFRDTRILGLPIPLHRKAISEEATCVSTSGRKSADIAWRRWRRFSSGELLCRVAQSLSWRERFTEKITLPSR